MTYYFIVSCRDANIYNGESQTDARGTRVPNGNSNGNNSNNNNELYFNLLVELSGNLFIYVGAQSGASHRDENLWVTAVHIMSRAVICTQHTIFILTKRMSCTCTFSTV